MRKKHFFLESHTEVATLVEALLQFGEDKKLYIIVAAFLHNTVLVQTLKRSIAEKLPNATLDLVKSSSKKGVEVISYVFEEAQESLGAQVVFELQKENNYLQEELKLCKNDLVQKYFHDHLTSLPNIFKLRRDLEEQSEVTLIDIAIDDFKSLNSFYGFLAGDFILEQVAEFFLKEQLQAYKMPGGEFIVLLPEYFHYYDLQEYIEVFYKKLSNLKIEYMNLEISLDFTLGVCSSLEIDAVLSKLSMALFYAQKKKLPYCIYEDKLEFEQNYSYNIEMTTKVRDAIKNDKLLAYFQPVVEIASSTIFQYEILARIIQEDNETLAPSSFLTIALQTKLYPFVTKKMVLHAIKAIQKHQQHFSINITQEDIYNQNVYEFIIQTLRENKNIAKYFVFELLIASSVLEIQKVKNFIEEVRRFGAKVTIDDFGNEYASCSLLTELKVDFIKIDGKLIEQIDKNYNAYIVVQNIVKIAKQLNIRVIAENVSTSTIYAKVKELGIDYAQGFFIDKPRVDIDKVFIDLE